MFFVLSSMPPGRRRRNVLNISGLTIFHVGVTQEKDRGSVPEIKNFLRDRGMKTRLQG